MPVRSPLQGHLADPHSQTFVCNLGYTLDECHKQVDVLRAAVSQYMPKDLGGWTWVLVRADEWKDLMKRMHLNSDSPAFSALDVRQTFLEESLIASRPERARELMNEFHIPLDHLLDSVITHELGHAMCHGGTEYLAEEYGRQIRAGQRPDCMDLYP